MGVLISLSGFKNEMFTKVLDYISASFGFLVAALLALSLKLPKAKGLVTVSLSTAIKFISGVLIGFFVVKLFGVTGKIGEGLILATASPVSVTCLVFAETEKLDTELMGQFVSASLILSLVSLPLLIAIF